MRTGVSKFSLPNYVSVRDSLVLSNTKHSLHRLRPKPISHQGDGQEYLSTLIASEGKRMLDRAAFRSCERDAVERILDEMQRSDLRVCIDFRKSQPRSKFGQALLRITVLSLDWKLWSLGKLAFRSLTPPPHIPARLTVVAEVSILLFYHVFRHPAFFAADGRLPNHSCLCRNASRRLRRPGRVAQCSAATSPETSQQGWKGAEPSESIIGLLELSRTENQGVQYGARRMLSDSTDAYSRVVH